MANNYVLGAAGVVGAASVAGIAYSQWLYGQGAVPGQLTQNQDDAFVIGIFSWLGVGGAVILGIVGALVK
jgi:hypothetical protein